MTNWNLPDDEQLAALQARIPSQRDDARILEISLGRQKILRDWLKTQGLGGVLLSRRDNFAWLTGGGDSHVVRSTETGSGHVLITPDEQYLLAYSMDIVRLMDEQLPGQNYTPLASQWHEGDPRDKASGLVRGKLASDGSFPGAEDRAEEIMRLHGSLAEYELDRLRWLGRATGMMLEAAAQWVQPGMTEDEIGWRMLAEFAGQKIDLEVIIAGSDERLQRIWHATPSEKVVRNYLSIHAAARRWGLHAPVNRFVCFGEPPERIRKAHSAAVRVEAEVLAALKPGERFDTILAVEKDAYARAGYPDEWRKHFQGGPSGYFLGDDTRYLTDKAVEKDTAFDWFLTVDGIQVEELSLCTGSGAEVASLGKHWPLTQVSVGANTISLPGMWVR